MTVRGTCARKWSVVVAAEDFAAIGAGVDPDLFEVVAADASGIQLARQNPKHFFGSRQFIAAATWSESSLPTLKQARRQIAAHGDADLPDVFLLEGERHAASLQSLVIHALKSLWERDAGAPPPAYDGQSKRDLAELTSLVRNFGIQTPECVFANTPGEAFAVEAELRQALPVSGARLCGFELHCARPSAAAAPLLLTLRGGAGSVLARWSPARLHDGWNRFALTPALAGAAEDLRIEIAANPLLSLSLSARRSDAPYWVQRGGVAAAGRMLALQLYAALPGGEAGFGGEPAMAAQA